MMDIHSINVAKECANLQKFAKPPQNCDDNNCWCQHIFYVLYNNVKGINL